MKEKLKNFLFKFLIFAFIIETITIGGLAFWVKNRQDKINYWEKLKFEKLNYVENVKLRDDKSELEQMREVQKQPKNIDDIKVIGWVPDWDFADGFEAIKEQPDAFAEVSPFWFDLLPDGSLKQLNSYNNQEFVSFLDNNDIELIPTITCFKAETLSQVLNSEENMQRNIDAIVEQVVANGYDGIDLDYESSYLRDQEKLFIYLKKLSAELIKKDKKLVFTALSKWGDRDVVYLGFPETRKTFNYKKIGEIVDELRIMAYEFTPKTSTFYGPIGPISWQEDVIRYAIMSGVPRDKIVLATPLYGHDFTEREAMKDITYYPTLFLPTDDSKPRALAYYYDVIDRLKKENGLKEEFNEKWGDAVGRYTDDGVKRIVVYPNQRSIEMRKKLVADYGIRGLGYWRIGDEGELKY